MFPRLNKRFYYLIGIILAFVFLYIGLKITFKFISGSKPKLSIATIELPAPAHDSQTSVEKALTYRRSIRTYKEGALTLQQLSQLLWSAQGITSNTGERTAPSEGALYPLEIYVVTGNVEGLKAGLYHYLPQQHALELKMIGNNRAGLTQAGFKQNSIKDGAIDIVITGVYKRTTEKYGDRGKRFVHMEAGHAAENLYLQAYSLNLGMVSIGGFDESAVKKLLALLEEETPLYIVPIGKI
ncbi:MAG: SagB/ThcOx family dehydrogenase [Gammaproteobacteria bacterium]